MSATNEQVITAYLEWEESQAGVITNMQAFQAGVTYATTLRQQAARVDAWQYRQRTDEGWGEWHSIAAKHVEVVRRRDDCEVRALAALAQNTQRDGEAVARAWDEGYRQGITDERTSEANIGIAGFDAKVEPARENPYRKRWRAERARVPDDTRRLQFVLDHVPHSVLADFGVLPENWMELAEGEAHIDDARACIDAQLAAVPSRPKDAGEVES